MKLRVTGLSETGSVEASAGAADATSATKVPKVRYVHGAMGQNRTFLLFLLFLLGRCRLLRWNFGIILQFRDGGTFVPVTNPLLLDAAEGHGRR